VRRARPAGVRGVPRQGEDKQARGHHAPSRGVAPVVPVLPGVRTEHLPQLQRRLQGARGVSSHGREQPGGGAPRGEVMHVL